MKMDDDYVCSNSANLRLKTICGESKHRDRLRGFAMYNYREHGCVGTLLNIIKRLGNTANGRQTVV